MTSSFLASAMVGALILCCCSAASPRMMSAPKSSRQLPVSLIEARIPKNDMLKRDAIDYVYEIDESGLLRGPNNLTVDLVSESRPLNVSTEAQTFSYTVNGEDRPSTEVDAVVVHKAGEFYLMRDDDKNIVTVWSHRVFLEPLDSAKYPGIFIDVAPSHSPSVLKGNGPSAGKTDYMRKASSRQASACKVATVAVAFDNTLCARFGNSASRTAAYVRNVQAYASIILQRDTCNQVWVSHIEAHCLNPNDPYDYRRFLSVVPTKQRSELILSLFRNYWQLYRRNIGRSLAYLFSGYDEGTTVGGVAFIGKACTSFGYGVVENGFAPIFVHEMGHSLGCPHSPSGIMKAQYRNGDPVQFSQFSRTQIHNFIRSSTASCLPSAA